jgi:hypothetical protein
LVRLAGLGFRPSRQATLSLLAAVVAAVKLAAVVALAVYLRVQHH